MTAFMLGPLVIPLNLLPWLAALTGALLVAMWRRRRGKVDVEPLLWWWVLAGMLGARIGFVAIYWQQYLADWTSIFDIRDGGWWWPGALIGAALAAVSMWRFQPALRQAGAHWELARVGTASMLSALPVLAVVMMLQPERFLLPELSVYQLSGEPVPLASVTGDELTVVNLWATWCPPCRREMPVLQQAQDDYPEVRFLLANQGESAASVRQFLLSQELHFDHLYLDPHSDLGKAMSSSALPTTLLVGPDGEVLRHHVGLLSAATLRHFIEQPSY